MKVWFNLWKATTFSCRLVLNQSWDGEAKQKKSKQSIIELALLNVDTRVRETQIPLLFKKCRRWGNTCGVG